MQLFIWVRVAQTAFQLNTLLASRMSTVNLIVSLQNLIGSFFLKIKYRAASSSKICKSVISSPMISCTPFEISSLLDSPGSPEFLGYLHFPHPQGILSLALDGETPHLASCILGAAFTLLTVRRLKR